MTSEENLHFWAKNALDTRCLILDARIFEAKMGVEVLETFENVGKFTKYYVKLTKIKAQRLKKCTQSLKICFERFSWVASRLGVSV